jgi:MoaA/NifB/PqqE/SkfB family radical SAM enzyme
MKAKIGKRYNITERTDLSKAIPLDTPLVLFIDPSSVCNFRCSFCPCGTKNKHNWSANKEVGLLSYSLFRKIVDDAVEFPNKIKTLRLYKEGEPLLNKRLPDMINYARKKNIFEKIDFTTNGYLLTNDLSLALVDAGVDRINISVESLTEKGYMDVSGVKINMDEFIKNIEYLYKNRQQCYMLIKISEFGLGSQKMEDFYEKFGDICDEISVEYISPVWPEFDLEAVKTAFDRNLYGEQSKERLVCPYIFYSICVNSSGTVSSCLMDWNHLSLVGDVRNDSLVTIWNNDNMRKMRIKNLEGNRGELGICANCGQMKYAAIDNIDDCRLTLLEKMQGG